MVQVKSILHGDIRRFSLPESPSFQQLRDRLAAIYGAETFVVKYKDEEGDLVTIATDAELSDALSLMSDSGPLLISLVRSDSVDGNSSPPPAPAQSTEQPETKANDDAKPSEDEKSTAENEPAEEEEEEETVTPEQLMETVAELFVGMVGMFRPAAAMHGCARKAGRRGMEGPCGRSSAQGCASRTVNETFGSTGSV